MKSVQLLLLRIYYRQYYENLNKSQSLSVSLRDPRTRLGILQQIPGEIDQLGCFPKNIFIYVTHASICMAILKILAA